MKTWILLLLPLLFLACNKKIVEPPSDGGNPDFATATLLPLRTGNWWEYQVTAADSGAPYTFRRSVRALKVIGDAGFYPITDSLASGRVDTIYYLRGVRDIGIIYLPFPADSAQPDTLFIYPHVHSNTLYWFGLDSVVVLYSPPGGPANINDSLYTVMGYQRYIGGDPHHSLRYELNSDSSGVLRETLLGAHAYVAVQTNRHIVP